MNRKNLLLLTLATPLLFACGSDSDSDSSTTTPTSSETSTPSGSDTTTSTSSETSTPSSSDTSTSTSSETSTPSSSDTTTASKMTLKGTVATGAPCVNGSVTAQNQDGVQSDPTQTDSGGNYTVEIPPSAPYLVMADGCGGDNGNTLYSWSDSTDSSAVVNVTTLTNSAVKMATGGADLNTVWSSWATSQPITTATINDAIATLTTQLQSGGFDPTTLATNFFSDPFAADGSGIDAVMDSIPPTNIVFDNCTMTMTINGQNTTQEIPNCTGAAGQTADTVSVIAAGNSTCEADLTMSITTPVAMTFPYKICYTNIKEEACNQDLKSQVEQSMAQSGQGSSGTLTVNSYNTVSSCSAGAITVDFSSQAVTTAQGSTISY
ncbi:MAG: carboxypeptidase regulatory-like domain-containing protein [Gammaproteobacteria bacterium]|nr:carboxypeptidase regulatory-like domain-containing protein [Gammaproteobacteria bacterium]